MKQLLVSLMSAILLVACGGNQAADKKAQLENLKKQQQEIAEQIKKIETELAATEPVTDNQKEKLVVATTLSPQVFKHYIEVQGRVEADENIAVSPKMAGVVINVLVKVGDKVSNGQTLAELDNKMIYQNQEEVKTSYEFAKTIFEKQKKLWEQKIGTELQYLTAKNNKESLEKRLAALQEQYEMTKIKSPINGTVDAVMPKVGEAVMPGLPAFRVVNFSTFKITAHIPENYATMLEQGDRVEVLLPDLDQQFSSVISFLGKIINPSSRTFDIEIKMGKLDFQVNPNMIAVLKINDFTADQGIVVPVNVVQKSDNENYVFVVGEEKGRRIAKKRTITVGMYYGSQVHIPDGLKAGEQLITVGYQELNEGQVIKF